MADILVRDLKNDVADKLKAKAAAANQSVAQYLRDLITRDVRSPMSRQQALALASEIRSQAADAMQPAAHGVREDRDNDYGNAWLDEICRP
ncbi:MAG: hypothetical protein AAGJ32_00815 [Pseudomonadota bacterium]